MTLISHSFTVDTHTHLPSSDLWNTSDVNPLSDIEGFAECVLFLFVCFTEEGEESELGNLVT